MKFFGFTMDSDSNNRRRGQSIIEAMLALSVVTVGFLGITTLLAKSFFYERFITDRITATYLAAEGIEITKSLIDHDMYVTIAGTTPGYYWGACFNGYENANGVTQLALDYTSLDCSLLDTYNTSQALNFSSSSDRYGYGTTAGSYPSSFSRSITITANRPPNSLPRPTELTVKSIVTWSTGPITSQSVVLEDHFYDWRY